MLEMSMIMKNTKPAHFEKSFHATFNTASENQSVRYDFYKITVVFQFPDSQFVGADWSEFEMYREANLNEQMRSYKTVFSTRDCRLETLTNAIGSATGFSCIGKGKTKNTLQVRTLS
jgi:hypothetical protein